jgi:hypothetical protein
MGRVNLGRNPATACHLIQTFVRVAQHSTMPYLAPSVKDELWHVSRLM